MSERQLGDALDTCLTLLMEEQVTVEECLARYPEQADSLRPLLELAVEMRRLPRPAARASAVRAGKRRMLDAVAEKRRQQRTSLVAGLRARLSSFLFGERAGAGVPALRVAAAAVTAVLLLVGIGLTIRSALGVSVARMATLQRAEGAVTVRRVGDEGWTAVSVGERLRPGDVLRTGEEATAALSFFEGSLSVMEGGTELTLREMSVRRNGTARAIVLHQRRGQTYYRVEPLKDSASRFVVETPAAVASVRGTEFAVSVGEDGATDVTVRQGLVEVSSGDGLLEIGMDDAPVAVLPGWSTNVQPSQPPATPFAAPVPMAEDLFEGLKTPDLRSVPTRTPSPTFTVVPSLTPSPTRTPEPTPTDRPTSQPREEDPTPTATLRPTLTPSPVPPTATRMKTATPVPSPTPTATPTVPTEPDTPEPPPTEEPSPTTVPTEPATPEPPPTERPAPTATASPTITASPTVTVTTQATATSSGTAQP